MLACLLVMAWTLGPAFEFEATLGALVLLVIGVCGLSQPAANDPAALATARLVTCAQFFRAGRPLLQNFLLSRVARQRTFILTR